MGELRMGEDKQVVFKNNIDVLIYTLGLEEVTDKKSITASDAWAMLGNTLNKSISTSKKVFYQAVKKELLAKVSDNPASYCFTKQGMKHLDMIWNLNKTLKGGKGFEEWISNYAREEFSRCVYDRDERFEIKYRDLYTGMGVDYAHALLEHPSETLEEMNKTIKEMDLPIYENSFPIVSIVDIGVADSIPVEEARDKKYIRRLIEVEGRVMQQSAVKPHHTTAAFECQHCEHVTLVQQKREGAFIEPYECDNDICGRKGRFELKTDQCDTINSQIIYVESIKGQEQVAVKLTGTMCAPRWERDAKFVKVVGVLDIRRVTKNQAVSFDYILYANSIKPTDDYSVEPPTDEEKKVFDEWALNPIDLRRKLRDGVAPHIFGYEDIKDVLSAAMYADWTWDLDPLKSDTRSSLHVFLVGDPGVAKSQLIRGAIRLVPGAVEAQGESSSGVGLSSAAVKDENGGWSIRSGAFAKADGNMIGFDELDKLDEEELKKLYTILERQIQIVDKAGVHAELNTRVGCLAAANPKSGHVNRYAPAIDQLGVPIAFYQRFDVTFFLVDTPEIERDGKVFDCIAETEQNAGVEVSDTGREIPVEQYKKYILYARSKPKPVLTDEVIKHIKDFYINARNGSRESCDSDVPALSGRMAQGLIKLTTALARRELATETTLEHAEMAVALYTASVVSLGLGSELDFSVVTDGSTHDQRTRIGMIKNCLYENRNNKGGVGVDAIGKSTGYTPEEIRNTLKGMKVQGDVYELKIGEYRLV